MEDAPQPIHIGIHNYKFNFREFTGVKLKFVVIVTECQSQCTLLSLVNYVCRDYQAPQGLREKLELRYFHISSYSPFI